MAKKVKLNKALWWCARCHTVMRIQDRACAKCGHTVYHRKAMHDGDELANIKKGELLIREVVV